MSTAVRRVLDRNEAAVRALVEQMSTGGNGRIVASRALKDTHDRLRRLGPSDPAAPEMIAS